MKVIGDTDTIFLEIIQESIPEDRPCFPFNAVTFPLSHSREDPHETEVLWELFLPKFIPCPFVLLSATGKFPRPPSSHTGPQGTSPQLSESGRVKAPRSWASAVRDNRARARRRQQAHARTPGPPQGRAARCPRPGSPGPELWLRLASTPF